MGRLACGVGWGRSRRNCSGSSRSSPSDSPSQRRGSAFGAYHLLVGLAALASNVTFGAVWDLFGSTAAFAGSGAVALAAAIALLALVSNGRAATVER